MVVMASLYSRIQFFLLSFVVITGIFCIGDQAAYASGAGVEFVNWYSVILTKLGIPQAQVTDWVCVLGSALSFTVIFIVGIFYKRGVVARGDNVVPSGSMNIETVVEGLIEFVMTLGRDVIGDKASRPYLPLLCSLFFFIFISNLSGLIPGFPPTTESINTNLAMGLMVFVIYNAAGIKEHGFAYIKQFTGPMLALAPLLFVIETIGHLVRPISLSLRLYGNIFGDHLVMSVLTGLTYVLFPSLLLFFGLLVASIQSFVFTLLSSIYISMAISHDH